MTNDLPFGMIDMTIVGSVSISRREIETEPGGEEKPLFARHSRTLEKENGSNGR